MKSLTKQLVAGACAGALAFGLGACSAERDTGAKTDDKGTAAASGDAGKGALIGIEMPTKSLERWNRDGAHLQKVLEEKGYKTDLQYADNKVEQQIAQLQNMINKDPKVLVVASIDGSALGPVLAKAKERGIPVIAYDRLIRDTDAVDYYATFDNYKVGQLQGDFLQNKLDLQGKKGPFNFEPFAGSPDDNNAKYFFSGAWDVLLPYVTDKQLVVPSGKDPKSDAQWQSIGTPEWSSAKAQSEMETRLNSFYTDKKVQAVLSPNDSIALGIIQALDAAGYKPGTDWPLLTGQDADLANVKYILEGKQAMTVWKDTRKLGDRVATMVDEIVSGKEVEVNDTKTYDNGKKVIPSYLLKPEVVTKENVKELLVDSGFYTAKDLGL